MSVDNFELVLRAQMKSHAAELDRSLRPAPQLRMLLDSPARAASRFGLASLRFGVGVVAVLALALVVISGSLLLQAPRAPQPLASLTPSPIPSLASPSATLASPWPSRASPSPSLAPPSASITVVFQPPAG